MVELVFVVLTSFVVDALLITAYGETPCGSEVKAEQGEWFSEEPPPACRHKTERVGAKIFLARAEEI